MFVEMEGWKHLSDSLVSRGRGQTPAIVVNVKLGKFLVLEERVCYLLYNFLFQLYRDFAT